MSAGVVGDFGTGVDVCADTAAPSLEASLATGVLSFNLAAA